MLAASASMPLLSDEYGNFRSTGVDVKPNPGRLSPIFNLKGEKGERTRFTMNDLDRDTRRVGVDAVVGASAQNEQAEELRAVRSQIVGMLSQRYPPEKRQEQLMAVNRAREKAEKDRAIRLADKTAPKKIYL